MKMEATPSSKTSVLTRLTQRHIPQDGTFYSHRCENLKSYRVLPVGDEEFLHPWLPALMITSHGFQQPWSFDITAYAIGCAACPRPASRSIPAHNTRRQQQPLTFFRIVSSVPNVHSGFSPWYTAIFLSKSANFHTLYPVKPGPQISCSLLYTATTATISNVWQ
jgi:hypothetical protein